MNENINKNKIKEEVNEMDELNNMIFDVAAEGMINRKVLRQILRLIIDTRPRYCTQYEVLLTIIEAKESEPKLRVRRESGCDGCKWDYRISGKMCPWDGCDGRGYEKPEPKGNIVFLKTEEKTENKDRKLDSELIGKVITTQEPDWSILKEPEPNECCENAFDALKYKKEPEPKSDCCPSCNRPYVMPSFCSYYGTCDLEKCTQVKCRVYIGYMEVMKEKELEHDIEQAKGYADYAHEQEEVDGK